MIVMNASKKLKTRNFQKSWETEFFVIENGSKAMCLVENCRQSLSLMRTTIKYHFVNRHSELAKIIENLSEGEQDEFKKNKLQEYQEKFKKSTENIVIENVDKYKLASFKIAYQIAKNLKYYTDSEFLKSCMLNVCETIFPGNIEIFQEFEKVCLGRTTVSSRISNISNLIENNLKSSCSDIKYFSICLDESNDKTDLKHLVIFIRGIKENFERFEEFLDLVALTKNSTGIEIFKQVDLVFVKFDLDYKKLISITCDGAGNLMGIINGLIALIKKHMKNVLHIENELFKFHCILHQENLCCKNIELDKVLEKVFKIVVMLKKHGNLHKDFKNFLQEENSDFSDVLYYTEVRWLSRAISLKRFFDLIENINKFYIEKDEKIPELSDPIWIFKLAFMVDLTSMLNDLNESLQGKNIFILDSFKQVQGFITKLKILKEEVEMGDFFHFLNAESTLKKFSINLKDQIVTALFSDLLKILLGNFEKRFKDFKNVFFDLFSNPFSVKRHEMSIDFQNEVKEMILQNFQIKFDKCLSNEEKIIFFKDLPDTFSSFKMNAMKISCMFPSSYLCEHFFSLLKFRKNQYSSSLTPDNLQSCLRIACSSSEPNYEILLKD